jgi:hypothetical protein
MRSNNEEVNLQLLDPCSTDAFIHIVAMRIQHGYDVVG